MLKRIPNSLSLIVLTLSIAACSMLRPPSDGKTGHTESLQGLKELSAPEGGLSKTGETSGKIRDMALKEVALSLGAQAALAQRAKYIDNALLKQARTLDIVYDFNALMLENDVLPPVLIEGGHNLNLDDPHTIRLSGRIYKIQRQARFVTTPPNWRQYLWMDYQPPEIPNVTLLPKDKTERELWDHYVEQGWSNGVEQANTIFQESVAQINEEILGMILYRKLLAMNMVSPPYVSHTDLGITGDSNEIHIDDRVLRITALPGLNIDSNTWRAALTTHADTIKRFKSMEKLIETAEVSISNKTWQPVIAPINERTVDK